MIKFEKVIAVDGNNPDEAPSNEEGLTLDPRVVHLKDDINECVKQLLGIGMGSKGIVYIIDVAKVNRRQLGNMMILQALFGFEMTENGKPFPGISEYVVKDPTEFKLYDYIMNEPTQCSYAGPIGRELGFDDARTSRYLKRLKDEGKICCVARGEKAKDGSVKLDIGHLRMNDGSLSQNGIPKDDKYMLKEIDPPYGRDHAKTVYLTLTDDR